MLELENELRSLRIEWEEWYDKYRRLYARISKRAERAQEDPAESRQDAPGSSERAGSTPRVNGVPRRNLRGF